MLRVMDVTERFSDKVSAYQQARIGYPPAFVDHLRSHIGLSPVWTVVDAGAGTGLSSAPLLDAGCRVLAVEPSAPMRAAAVAALGDRPRFEAVAGRAEATGLPDGCADMALAACAFHWFDPAAVAAEWRRILRGDRWAVLLWTLRRPEASAFTAGLERLIERWATDYAAVKARYAEPGAMGEVFGAGGWRVAEFESRQTVDWEGLAARIRSTSYVPAPGADGHAGMMDELEALYAEHAEGERVTIEYRVPMYFGRVAGQIAGQMAGEVR